jgi:hypothetical protein
MHVVEDQVFGRAAQGGVRMLLVFGNDEELAVLQAADDHVPHLDGSFPTREPVHKNAL